MTNPALSSDQSIDAGERGVAAPPIEATEQVGAAEIQCYAQTTVQGLTSRGNHFL
jgi:hypothetical protein